MKKAIHATILLSLLFLFLLAAAAHADQPAQTINTRLIFTDETEFLNTIASLGYTSHHEGFEDDNAWGIARSPITAPGVTSLGLTWTANNVNSQVTTGSGPVRTGLWGFYTLPHGDPYNGINDGWIITSAETLFAFGGWIKTNTPPANLALILDGDEGNPVDFDGGQLWAQHQFFGVIDTDGFTQVEFRETEATPPNELKYIFGDDFFWAAAADDLQNAPLLAWNIATGTPQGGGLAALQVSDDDYAYVLSAPSGSRQIVTAVVAAQSPLTTVSALNLKLEAAVSSGNIFGVVRLRNFDNGSWYTLSYFPITITDTPQYFLDAPDPNRFVRDSDGLVMAQIISLGYGPIFPNGYTLRLDQIEATVAP